MSQKGFGTREERRDAVGPPNIDDILLDGPRDGPRRSPADMTPMTARSPS